MNQVGFDSEKYIRLQSEHIRERINQFGGKLYLEFGGKLFDDYHASRVLPGFAPDNKIKMLLAAAAIRRKSSSPSTRATSKRTSAAAIWASPTIMDVMRLIDVFRSIGLYVGSVVHHAVRGSACGGRCSRSKHGGARPQGLPALPHSQIIPSNVRLIVSDEGYGNNDYIETTRPLVVVTAPGPGTRQDGDLPLPALSGA